jgi:GGDEF domain-containing protein
LGGDEFGLVITEGPEPAAAEQTTARLLAAAATDIEVDGRPLRVGLSIGEQQLHGIVQQSDIRLGGDQAHRSGSAPGTVPAIPADSFRRCSATP